jgi:hypothetical protein
MIFVVRLLYLEKERDYFLNKFYLLIAVEEVVVEKL